MSGWKTLSSRIAYENPYTYVQEDKVINPAGQETVYGIMKSKADGVYIVPVNNEGNTYLVRQFRYTTQKMSWEVASGRVDEKDFLAAANRELKEETGVKAEKFTELCTINSANGCCYFREVIFLAEDLTETNDELDPIDGILERKKIPLAEAIDMAVRGEISCPQTITALFLTQEHLKRRSNVSPNH